MGFARQGFCVICLLSNSECENSISMYYLTKSHSKLIKIKIGSSQGRSLRLLAQVESGSWNFSWILFQLVDHENQTKKKSPISIFLWSAVQDDVSYTRSFKSITLWWGRSWHANFVNFWSHGKAHVCTLCFNHPIKIYLNICFSSWRVYCNIGMKKLSSQ